PQLVEEAVLRAVVRHKEESEFRKERDKLYEWPNDEAREEAFQVLHQRWFARLRLNAPLQEVFACWPILKKSNHKCLLIKARSKKEISAELHVAPGVSVQTERDRRTIIIQVTPGILCQPKQLLSLLRHEMLHIADMLDPEFGYEPYFPRSAMGPTYDHFLQERYRILWDITIDGRLCQKGWVPPLVREKYWAIFQDAFRGSREALETVFGHFFDKSFHTHQELLSFAQAPESWLANASSTSSTRGHCALCHFPSFCLIDASTRLSPASIYEIHREHPAWHATQPICLQCADLYEARLASCKQT
ncbi:MAG: hypothetical protein ACE5NG_03140, partial [bacterium]